jgi:hypothetical protein
MTPPTTNMVTAWVKLRGLHHPPSRHTSTNRGTLLFLPKTVRTEGNGESTWLVSGARQRTGSANRRIRLPSSRAPTLLRAYLGALQDTRERCRSYSGYGASCAGEGELRVFGPSHACYDISRECRLVPIVNLGRENRAGLERIANGVGVMRPNG